MNKNIAFILKLLAIVCLAAGAFFPLLTGTVSIEWITGAPPDAPAEFSGTILEIGIMDFSASSLEYDDTTDEFLLEEQDVSATDNEFYNAMMILQQVTLILLGVSAALILIAALIHLGKPSKFASFLILLGFLAALGILALAYILQTQALQGMASGGTLEGNSFYKDEILTIGANSYTWRLTATLSLGMGYFMIAAGAGLSFISLFLKGDYEE
ncbi:MAG: hypothetical protein INQ03_21510 [Candidatus Heimdallarchaeota archaeon]|nr:hypothetical protein [Candidatus Heimdallarchaeota archaeon]